MAHLLVWPGYGDNSRPLPRLALVEAVQAVLKINDVLLHALLSFLDAGVIL
jgi:hypothetical protein